MKIITILPLILFTASLSLSAQSIIVGSTQDGFSALNLDDAALSSTFSFITGAATLSNAQIKSATDSLGTFYYITAKGHRKQQSNIKIAIMLTELSGGLLAFFDGPDGGCEMECLGSPTCANCEQEIIVRCQSQKCSYVEGDGGVGSEIRFSK